MARAKNLLNQEFTYLGGTISNDGAQNIKAMEVTIEFHDAVQSGDSARHRSA